MTGWYAGVRLHAPPGRRGRGPLSRLVRRCPFTVLGCLSFGLMYGGLLLLGPGGEEAVPRVVLDVWRLLVVPAYLASLAAARWGGELLSTGGGPSAWSVPLSYGLRLAPFLVADLGFAVVRRVASS